MINEYSFGIIPLRKKKEWQVFLVQNKNGMYWGFPKGHSIHNEELHQDVARRELKEETNLDIDSFFPLEPFIEEYEYVKNEEKRNKRASYFLATVNGKIKLQKEEILDGKWINLSEATLLLTYPQSKDILEKVKEFLDCLGR
jgi:8-oxo-dGTP pyrophosphatase MutT (NUDIX family)